ncbi:acyl-CoA dehydrogenase family protein, partial [Duncaniella muris]|uniref:acyl-CoA dehydrogenase family protein n=1 Tax=Duncaniella muris TaxID=2094150 RepID=UPI002675FCED
MANFYTDNPDLRHHLTHPLMEKIVALKERNYTDAEKFDYAPLDYADAQDSYDKVLEIVGEICGDIIAPNAEDVDHQGPRVENGRVIYADKTQENLDACRKAGLMGMAMPRRYGGLNFPITPYIMAADIVSRADTGFENLWGLQDCAETIYEFADEAQKEKFITRVCQGETMSMDLTEPDAGSDLQSVMLKATEQPDGTWLLNGVKRFITNGDSDIHLVLARSEAGTKDGRGLSMFIYDKRDGGVNVRRIENKMGIKGSPTCELTYKNAKAVLCGSRRLGLIKYVMALMNGARLGIAAQSVGVSELAYREALAYARDRKQFGKAIIEFPAVYEMLSVMKAKLDASRSLLYACARYVDIYKIYDDLAKERSLTPEERKESKYYSRLGDALTPLAKGMGSEYCNQNAYDCIQVHGGSGFMKDYACERVYRDARITSIYEGTTQLQVVAAIRHVTTGTYRALIDTYAAQDVKPELEGLRAKLSEMCAAYDKAVQYVLEVNNPEYTDFMARRLVEMAGNIVMGHLLVLDANRNEAFFGSANVYINMG